MPRLSVSALKTYNSCPKKYWFEKVSGEPVEYTHHMDAGTLCHTAFYMAYGTPGEIVYVGAKPGLHDKLAAGIPLVEGEDYRYLKTSWTVREGFHPEDGVAMFSALWHRDPELLGEDRELRAAYDKLAQTDAQPSNFVPGPLKDLKVGNPKKLAENWYAHYLKMVEQSLAQPLEYPVVEIEREVEYMLGSQKCVGYIDLVLAGPQGDIFVDLKSGYSKPNSRDLFFDEQMNCYYRLQPTDIWYYHLRSGEILPVDENLSLQTFLDRVADQVALAIENNYYPERYSKDCLYCAFRQKCIGT